jgi:hypothetical protein
MASQQADSPAKPVNSIHKHQHHIRRKPVQTTGPADGAAQILVLASQQVDSSAKSAHSIYNTQQHHIRRKPVDTTVPTIGPADAPSQYALVISPHNEIFAPSSSFDVPLNTDLAGNDQNFTANARQRSVLSIETNRVSNVNQSSLHDQVERLIPSAELVESPTTLTQSETPAPSSAKSRSVYFQKAYEEARHRLGGLIQHQTESTKHFTILRHSHGIVFYNGSHTYLTISIFADAPLPPDRTLWLQSKGWTGKTGMKTKARFGFNDSWVNVTPTTIIRPTQVPPTDERAWQRDIAKFRRKAPLKIRQQHLLRETCIMRVPAKVEDGYLQIILSHGDAKKKVLCRSPVFRVLSTSFDMSKFRGASLTTLPFELGIYVAGLHAQAAASSWASSITSPVQNLVQPFMPSSITQRAASVGWSVSGLQNWIDDIVGNANRFDWVQGAIDVPASKEDVNLESGPQPPYPFSFKAQLDSTCGNSISSTEIRTEQLIKVPQEINQRLHGWYFGWCRVGGPPKTQKSVTDVDESINFSWQQVVISSLTVDESAIVNVKAANAFRREIALRFIEELDYPSNVSVEVQIMGFIRLQQSSISSPTQADRVEDELAAAATAEEHLMLETFDVSITESTLGHPAWAPGRVSKGQTTSFDDKIQDTYAKMRTNSENMMDRVPVHKLGVRGPFDVEKDQHVSVNGFYIVREA